MGTGQEPSLSLGSRGGVARAGEMEGRQPPHFLVGSSRTVTTSPQPQP